MASAPIPPELAGYDTISFLSDYGTADEFVGVVKSVIRQLAPTVAVLDITHEVPPHDVRAGGLTLARSAQYLAPGVVVAVVDPGVGSDRRGVAIEVGDGISVLVGPDNGLLAPAVALVGGATRAFALTNADYHLPAPGPTFDGRDVFAPVAAHLCNGVPIEELGTEVDPNSLTPGLVPLTSVEDDDDGVPVLSGEVLWVDHFGNVQLNVDPDEIAGWGDRLQLRTSDDVRTARRVTAFGQLATGEIGLLVDADGLLAIVTDRHPASEELRLATGDPVALTAILGDERVGVRTSVTIGRPSTTNPGGV